jgi:hypothetical protein
VSPNWIESILAAAIENDRKDRADRIRELAREGAERLLENLRAEIIAIERTFPELALPAKRRAVRQTVQSAGKRGRAMFVAARKAVSERMKKYWAERRKAKGQVVRTEVRP